MPSTEEILAEAAAAADVGAVREASGLSPEEGGAEGNLSAEPSATPAAAATPVSNGNAAAALSPEVANAIEDLVAEVASLREQVERRDDPELDSRLEDVEELRKEVLRRSKAKKDLAITERKRRVAELADRIIQDSDDPNRDLEGVAIRPRRPAAPGSPDAREPDQDDLKSQNLTLQARVVEMEQEKKPSRLRKIAKKLSSQDQPGD